MKDYFRTDLVDKGPSVINVPVRERMMCLNESCLDPFQEIREQFLARMVEVRLNRYLSPVTDELHTKLTAYAGHGLKPENLVWANGADDILYHAFLSVRENADSFAVSLAPSYFDYKTFCGAVGLGIRFVELRQDFSFDTQAYLRLAAHPDCKLAILCNPNNPTGNLFAPEQLREIVDSLPGKLVLIDETYFEFSGWTFAGELEQHPNLMLVRSFSKAFSGAGLRFGYAISSASNIYSLRKVFTTFHTSILTQAFALSILDSLQLFRTHVGEIKAARDFLFTEMKALPGLIVYPSATNFLTFTIGEDTPRLFAHLKDRGIALRDVGAHPRLRNCLRATVSCSGDNAALLGALREFLQH